VKAAVPATIQGSHRCPRCGAPALCALPASHGDELGCFMCGQVFFGRWVKGVFHPAEPIDDPEGVRRRFNANRSRAYGGG
jgi:hypothetical protein